MAQTVLTRPIVLVGLMGAGKTSVGRCLAEELKAPFRDSDAEIEAAAGMTIPEIFEQFGERDFRAGEVRVIARLLSEGPAVLATGGGAFMNAQVRANVAAEGLSVWINAPVAVLWDRVKGRTHRPLLQNADPYGVLSNLHAERSPVYAKADLIVPSAAEDKQVDVAGRILDKIRAERPEFLRSKT
ncbi:shikimate kinase [Paracoccaceae bacterium GXU_MW_L88]